MSAFTITPELREQIEARGAVLREQLQRKQWIQTDRMFAVLLTIQWIAGIAAALWLSPRAWEGLTSRVNPHIWEAVGMGGLVAACPIFFVIVRPGEAITRYLIATAQMLHSAMLIHLTGGRIETHFHVFGSLAFLSFYRDWRVMVPATIVVAADHALRGIFYPESVFGVITASPYRWIEHAGWVVFEDIILVWSCVRGARELSVVALRQAELESANAKVEAEVARQTARLESVSQELITTARKAGMADIATGVLHNVGNVLNSVNVSTSVALRKVKESEISSLVKVGEMIQSNRENISEFLTTDERGKMLPGFLVELAQCLGDEQKKLEEELKSVATGLDHIKEIVGAQQQHAKKGKLREKIAPTELFDRAISMDIGSAAIGEMQIVRNFEDLAPVALDKHKVLQILINLLSNAKKAVSTNGKAEKCITVSTRRIENGQRSVVRFEVTDNGVGIEAGTLPKLFAHGYTTRADGHGFGLHSAANAAGEMGGRLTAASDGPGCGATFTLELPADDLSSAEKVIAESK